MSIRKSENTTETEIINILQTLVSLFPKEHPKCKQWLKDPTKNLKDNEVEVKTSDSSINEEKMPNLQNKQTVKTPNRPVSRPKPPYTKPKPPVPFTPRVQTFPLPKFAKEVHESLEKWKQKIVSGKPFESWDDEKQLYEQIQRQTGLGDAQLGFLGSVFILQQDLQTLTNHKLTLEVYIPRIKDPEIVLIVAQKDNKAKKQFEVSVMDLSPQNIKQLVQFVEQE
jgi:hypothetical protein